MVQVEFLNFYRSTKLMRLYTWCI